MSLYFLVKAVLKGHQFTEKLWYTDTLRFGLPKVKKFQDLVAVNGKCKSLKEYKPSIFVFELVTFVTF